MKNFLPKSFGFLLLFCFLILENCSEGKILPKAEKGVLDLRDWKFEGSDKESKVLTDGIINLDGEWEFYWETLPIEENSLSLASEKRGFISVPNAWNGYKVKGAPPLDHEEKKINGQGYGTYRLKVYLPEFTPLIPLLIKVPGQATAFKIYIEDQFNVEVGKVGSSKESSIPSSDISYLSFTPRSKVFFITIVVSNFHDNKGGLWGTLTLGTIDGINQARVKNVALDLFVTGILFIMGVYHLSLYYLRRDDPSALYFGLLCFSIGTRNLVTGEVYLKTLFPFLKFSFMRKLEYLSLYMLLPVFNEYLYSLYPEEIFSFLHKYISRIGYIFISLVLILPPLYFTTTLQLFQLILIVYIFYTIVVIVKAVFQKRDGGRTILSGFLILGIVSINDILHNNHIINTMYLASYGFIVFIYSQSFLLTSRFAGAFKQVKDLSQNLETKIKDRTKDLESATREILSSRNEVQKAKDMIEESLAKAFDLNEMIQIIIKSESLEEILENVNRLLRKKYNIYSYCLYIANFQEKKIKYLKSYGHEKYSENEIEEFRKIEFDLYDIFCVHSNCIIKNKTFMSNKIKNPNIYRNEKKIIEILGMNFIYIIPLQSENKAFGTITISDNKFNSNTYKSFTSEDKKELENFIKLISPSIYQSLQKVEIERTNAELNLQKEKVDQILNKLLRINAMNEAIVQSNSLNDLFYKLLNVLNINYNINSLTIYLIDEESSKLRPFDSFSLVDEDASEVKEFLSKNIIDYTEENSIHKIIIEKGKGYLFKRLKKEFASASESRFVEFLKMKSYYPIPLINDGKTFGILGFSDNEVVNSNLLELTKTDRTEIENYIKIITPSIYQSLQKQKIEAAYAELQATQNQLIEAERMASLGQLVGGIAHEINNPIAVIHSHAELLEQNNSSTLKIVPEFLETLSPSEKTIFYEIVEQSLKNRIFLNSKDERKQRKDTEKMLSERVEDENLRTTLSESLVHLRLPPPYETYIQELGAERFSKFLTMAEVFKNQSNSLSSIEIAVEKASRIVFALRSYLNTELSSSRKEVDLVKELDKALHVYDNYVMGKINVLQDFPGELKLTCVAENISQVWKNLFFNAIQAMYTTDKKLELRLEQVEKLPESLKGYKTSSLIEESLFQKDQKKGWIVVSITDSGSGIPIELQEKVFTPFFTTKSLGEGIGLGLYTCKKIVHEHRGALFFRSGEGRTEFVVVLPS